MIIIYLLVFGLAASSTLGEFIPYTTIAVTTDGKECLGGCSPETQKCVINFLKTESSCRTKDEPAPIYFTSQNIDKNSKYCLSNCGKFGKSYEWCITKSDFTWDYCTSKLSSLATETRLLGDTYTCYGNLCQSACTKTSGFDYLWCYDENNNWAFCAPAAISRVPILNAGYNVKKSTKGSCKAFLKSLHSSKTNFDHDSSTANDNYIRDTADAIETVYQMSSNSNVFKTNNNDTSVKKYTLANVILTNGTNALVPAIIRAYVKKDIPESFETMIIDRAGYDTMEYNNELYETYYYKQLIKYEIGGPDEKFNYVPQSGKLTEALVHVTKAINKWCDKTNGSVDVVIVIFYPDAHTILPRAIGVDLTFNNDDENVFVVCKDTIYWNNL